MVKQFDKDEVLEETWELWTGGGTNCCCACDGHSTHSWYVKGDAMAGKKLKSCPNSHTSWCALCEDCGKQLGVVW